LKLWGELQKLRLSVDALWEAVTDDNLVRLTEQLESAERQLSEWCIFIEKDHLDRLRHVLTTLGSYETGKFSLRKLQRENLYKVDKGLVLRQIRRNAGDRREFEAALEAIRLSFQNRLSAVAVERSH